MEPVQTGHHLDVRKMIRQHFYCIT